MRKHGQKLCGVRRRRFAPHRRLADDDDPLFEEREMEIAGAGDDKTLTPDH